MGWTLHEIKLTLKDIRPEERLKYLIKEYPPEELKRIFDALMDELMVIQKKMSIYHNGYEEIKRGKSPSEVKNVLKAAGYSEAEEIPNPDVGRSLKWLLNIFGSGVRELSEWAYEVLIYVGKALGSAVNLESVSVTASIPPSITFNFKLS